MDFHAKWVLAAMVVGSALGIAAPARAADDGTRVGAPWDWSHRHLIYGNPETVEEAIANGTYDRWQKNYRDPRFVRALVNKMDALDAKRAVPTMASAQKAAKAATAWPIPPRPFRNPMHRDWSYPMGGSSGVGAIGMFPAKYSFDISATPSCANDYVVYATNSAGASAASPVLASQTGTFSGQPNANTVTITNGSFSVVITRSLTVNTGLFFASAAADTNTTRAANLAAAIDRNGGPIGVTATSSGATVTVTAVNPGAGGNAITLAESMSNFSWSGGNLAGGSGTAGQPTIFALNQLYSSCAGVTQGNPDVFWSYNTGTGSIVETSPIISLDGTQVAFIQRSAANVASLVILKWSSSTTPGTMGQPTAPTSVTPAAYRACTAPCMTVMALSGNPNNTRSSPYYFYDLDKLWVGDAAGKLHYFTGVFNGTPAEAGSPWPITVVAGVALSSPVYDGGTDLVFVGSARDNAIGGGALHSVNATTGAVISTGQLSGTPASTTSTGVAEAPLVDSLAQRVYAFAASGVGTNCAGVECQSIYQFVTTSSIAGLTSPRVEVGRGQIFSRVMYAGVFDAAYYASTPSSPTGFMYVCGSIGSPFASSRRPTLWRIPITANAMGTPVVGPTLVSADTADNQNGCSPITDVQSGANNRIYVAVPSNGNATGCTGECIYMFTLGGAWGTGTTASAGLTAAGGTGGIIIDNISGTTGASQVYYSTRTSPGRAIQASQSALN